MIDIRESALRALREASAPTHLRQAIEQRTGLQFLANWYEGQLGDLLRDLRLDELDAELRKRTQTETPVVEDVPPGVPASHWWWHRP